MPTTRSRQKALQKPFKVPSFVARRPLQPRSANVTSAYHQEIDDPKPKAPDARKIIRDAPAYDLRPQQVVREEVASLLRNLQRKRRKVEINSTPVVTVDNDDISNGDGCGVDMAPTPVVTVKDNDTNNVNSGNGDGDHEDLVTRPTRRSAARIPTPVTTPRLTGSYGDNDDDEDDEEDVVTRPTRRSAARIPTPVTTPRPTTSYGDSSDDEDDEDKDDENNDDEDDEDDGSFELSDRCEDIEDDDEVYDPEEEALEELQQHAESDPHDDSDDNVSATTTTRRQPARRANGDGVRSTSKEWTLEDFPYLNFGNAQTDIHIDEKDLATGDAFMENIINVRCKERTGMTNGFANYLRVMDTKLAMELFRRHTPEYVRANLGVQSRRPDFDFDTFSRLPAPTQEHLNGPAIYHAVTVRQSQNRRKQQGHIGQYIGQGNKRKGQKPGSGARFKSYSSEKQRIMEGVHTYTQRKGLATGTSQKLGRHLTEALKPNVDWHFRVLSTAPKGSARGLVCFLEAIWVDAFQTLTDICPAETEPSVRYQNPIAVTASRSTVPLERRSPKFIQLNGASPFTQGCAEIGEALREMFYTECDGICGCCKHPLAPYDEWKTQPLYRAVEVCETPLHLSCLTNWGRFKRMTAKGTLVPKDPVSLQSHVEKFCAEQQVLAQLKKKHNVRRGATALMMEKLEFVHQVQNDICPACGTDYAGTDFPKWWHSHEIAALEGSYICRSCSHSWIHSYSGHSEKDAEAWIEFRHGGDSAIKNTARGGDSKKRLEVKKRAERTRAVERDQGLHCKFCQETLTFEMAMKNVREDAWIECPIDGIKDQPGCKWMCKKCYGCANQIWRYNKHKFSDKQKAYAHFAGLRGVLTCGPAGPRVGGRVRKRFAVLDAES